MKSSDVIVIGAGMVGAALAVGLAERGLSVRALDGGDGDFRASRANFGLVSVQGKGLDMPAYQRLTRESADGFADFAAGLADRTGIDVHHERRGMIVFCLGEAELDDRRNRLFRLHNQYGAAEPDFEMLDRDGIARLLPATTRIGDEVTGASFGHSDGTVNPLRLLSALHRALVRAGGELLCDHAVTRIEPSATGFTVEAGGARFGADRIVIAAGIATGDLARQIGLDIPVRPQRGQLLVTERLSPLLTLPASGLRQTAEGTMMIGLTQEEVGPDTGVTVTAAGRMSRRAIRILPALAHATLVRQWAGLRVMAPDAFPIYAGSDAYPGATVAMCHSGVTLAAAHAGTVAASIAAGTVANDLAPFHHGRFHVPKTA